MIAVLKPNAPQEKRERLIEWLRRQGINVQVLDGEFGVALGLDGNTGAIDPELLRGLDIVDSVSPAIDPLESIDRANHPIDSVISIDPHTTVGGGSFLMIAGPCSVESREQITDIALLVGKDGANCLRGGAFKPRTSPHDFQGLGGEGIALLLEAKRRSGLPIVTEIMDIRTLDLFENVDIIQVGARNAQNFDLLKELGRTRKPILLKRSPAGTIRELLMSAEYIIAGGNENVILCERGIRTYDNKYTRNTLDLSAVPVLKELTCLPVIVDPSHGTGHSALVAPMALAAAAAGADGLMIEVHNDPMHARSDGAQALTPEQFREVAQKVRRVREAIR